MPKTKSQRPKQRGRRAPRAIAGSRSIRRIIGRAPRRQRLSAPPVVNTNVTAPVAVTRTTRQPETAPLVFSYSEEIGDVRCAEEFVNTPMVLTMTNPELFPYGHKLAQLFHTREFVSLYLRYEPNCPTDTGGTIAAVNNPDADQPPFTTMEEVLRHEKSVQSAPWNGWKVDLLSASTRAIPRKFNETLEGMVGLGERASLEETLHTVADGVVNFAVKGLISLISEEKKTSQAVVANLRALAGAGDEKGEAAKKALVQLGDVESMVTGKLFVDYTVKLYNPVNEDVDTGIFMALGNDDAKGNPPETNPWTNGEVINELGLEVSYARPEGDIAALHVDAFEAGYYLVTIEVSADCTVSSGVVSQAITQVQLDLAAGGTPVQHASELVQELNGHWNEDSGEIRTMFPAASDAADFNERPYAAILYFQPLDAPADDALFPDRLLNILYTKNTDYDSPSIGLKLSIAFVGESLEMSAIASALGKLKGGLHLPKNRAFFHHMHEKRRAKIRELRTEARTVLGAARKRCPEKEKKKTDQPPADVKSSEPPAPMSAAAAPAPVSAPPREARRPTLVVDDYVSVTPPGGPPVKNKKG